MQLEIRKGRVLCAAVISAWCVMAGPFAEESASVSAEGDTSPGVIRVTHTAMGTEFEFTIFARPDDADTEAVAEIADEAFQAIDDLERRISSWVSDSQTTYINHHAAEGPVRTGADLLDLILTAKRIHKRTGGAFDCTVGPVMKVYGFYDANVRTPDSVELERARLKVGMDKVSVDREAGTVSFGRKGMALDFGAIGKGLALDRAVEILRRRGVEHALLHAGTSTVFALGESGWKVRIRHPYNGREPIASVVLLNESLSTSGCYGGRLELEAAQICNVIDPRTALPVDETLSATAIAATAAETDALSTAFLVLGVEGTRRYCEENPGVRAIVVPATESSEPYAHWIAFNEQREISEHENRP